MNSIDNSAKDEGHPLEGPLIYLAGPMKGGQDWQEVAIRIIQEIDADIHVASPHRRDPNPGTHPSFPHQLDWEIFYMHIAARNGAILFWLPVQDPEYDGPYAINTRGELGEWRGRLAYEPDLHVVIGAEPDFIGLNGIKRNYWHVVPDMPFYETLQETCEAAVQLARQ